MMHLNLIFLLGNLLFLEACQKKETGQSKEMPYQREEEYNPQKEPLHPINELPKPNQ